MDPLHPLVPIQPPSPTPPDYKRVERVDRDGQQADARNWQRGAEDDAEEDAQEQFEDDYDPDWSDPAGTEPYGPDGVPHDTADAEDVSLEPERSWDPKAQGDRREHEQPGDGHDDSDPGPGPHIDISA